MLSFIRSITVWIPALLPTTPLFNRLRPAVYKWFGTQIGTGTTFCSMVRIKGNVRIGKHCNFNENVLLSSTGKGAIIIGDYTITGPNVVIRNANHMFADVDKPIRYQGKEIKDVIIGKDVWIAANVVILPGTRIGDGAVIGAGAVVTGEIPPFVVAVGVPAKVKKYRCRKPISNLDTGNIPISEGEKK